MGNIKINVAELLRNCSRGMELDCTLYEDVYFDWVDELNIIHCYIQHETHKTSITFNQHGTPNSDIKSKCVIFPKGKTSWEGFVPPCQFKDGDIIFSQYYDSKYIAIVKTIDKSNDIHVHCLYDYTYDTFATNKILGRLENSLEIRFAKEEEKIKLFDSIKANGYNWNSKTKTLEKLIESKFKDGDILYIYSANPWICIYKEGGEKENVYYKHVAITSSSFVYDCSPLCHRNHVNEIRHATEEEKIKLFQAIKDNGYKWNEETNTLEKLIGSKFNDGDIISSNDGRICIFKKNGKIEGTVDYYCGIPVGDKHNLIIKNAPYGHFGEINKYRLATEEEKQKLFDTIKYYSYKWNPETKTLEKLLKPKFKVGDRIVDTFRKCMGSDSSTGRISQITDDKYIFTDGSYIYIKNQDNWELVPNKFGLNTLVPFESKVLVRNDESQFWIPAFWGCKRSDSYTTTFGWCKYCIPYEGNEHLLETNKDCNEYYKTWK